jgi:F-type H+-transporting ATPase subunit a
VSNRRILGCSFPVLIGILVIVLAVGAISLLGGALGSSLFGDTGLPDVFTVDSPHVQLPAEGIFTIGGFTVTNTLISAWITMAVLVVLSWAVTRRIRLIPTRLQNLLEFAIEWLLNFCQDVAGEKNGRKFFPVIATIFLFVVMNSWISLIPGFGSITYTVADHGETHVLPLLRGANTDVNFTLALALISFVFVEYLGFSMGGGLGYLRKFVNFTQLNKGVATVFRGNVKSGLGGMLMGGVDVFVGVLEGIAEIGRIISFTFRLFGNMLGGEILILMMLFLMPYLLAVPFYGLELLVGLVQALIFGGLTLVFATIAATPHGEHEEAH